MRAAILSVLVAAMLCACGGGGDEQDEPSVCDANPRACAI